MDSIERKRQEILEKLADYDRKIEEAKSYDPFWYYEPSSGEISADGMALMKEFLKPEDVPVGRLEGQLDVHLSTANIILDAGGNQGGKTTACAIEGIITATGALPKSLEEVYPKEKLPTNTPQHVRVVGVDHQTFLRNLLPTYQKWVPKEYLIDGRWDKSYNSEGRVLSLGKKGVLTGTIEFMTNQQDVESFQGPPRHKVIYDEEPRSDIYRENLMRFTTANRLSILFGMTPTSGLSWVKDAILDRSETEEGNTIACFKVPSITNKKANLSILRELLRGLSSYEEVKMRLLGEFVSLSGLVYGRLFNKKVHVIEPFELSHDDYIVYRGIDPHLVKPSVCVEMAVDRNENKFVVGAFSKDCDTQEYKDELARRVTTRGYRIGWSRCDKSANSNIRILGNRNIFKELSTGTNAIPALDVSEKFTGSINAGIDEIKKDLKLDEKTKQPKLFIFNTKENAPLINAMISLERDTYADEDRKGKKDRIMEGKFDHHAALRYIYQRIIRWISPQEDVPEPEVGERYI